MRELRSPGLFQVAGGGRVRARSLVHRNAGLGAVSAQSACTGSVASQALASFSKAVPLPRSEIAAARQDASSVTIADV